jgi:hypothetical protein
MTTANSGFQQFMRKAPETGHTPHTHFLSHYSLKAFSTKSGIYSVTHVLFTSSIFILLP